MLRITSQGAAAIMARRPSRRSWAGGLYHRLLARGLDPYSARMVSRHVRADIRVFIEQLERELDHEVGDMADVAAAIERVMGMRV